MKSYAPGVLICFVCGLLDATCFLGLGGTFVGLMTGNLILMGVSRGGAHDATNASVFLYPLFGFSLGAFIGGCFFRLHELQKAAGYAPWIALCILTVITLGVWLAPVELPALSAGRWIVVSATALYIGFQSAFLYLSKRVAIATSVMTSNLIGFLADFSLHIGRKRVGIVWYRLFGLLGFLLGAVVGAWLVSFGVRFSFLLALAVSAIAMLLLMQSGTTSPAAFED